MKYQRIDDAESNHNGDGMSVELAPAGPIAVTVSDSFCIKVLHQEKAFDITSLSQQSTVGQLRVAVFNVTQIPVARQRLIFSGKHLKPDEKTLASFKIDHGSRIHLFPLPEVTTVPAAAIATRIDGATTSGTAINPLTATLVRPVSEPVRHQPIHFDQTVEQTSREVKLWCIILMFLSGLALFNNLSFITSTGE